MGSYLIGRLIAAAAAMVLLAAGCTGGDESDGELPAAAGLLTAAADEMAQVETVTMQLAADVDVADLPVREVSGVVTRAGEAEGTATIEQFGQLVELRFVVLGDTFHYQLLGGWAQLPREQAAEFYDPSVILDPDRGVANLLRTATDPEVLQRDGDRYQVAASFDAEALAALLPDAGAGTTGTLWIGVDRPLLHRAEFPLSGDDGPAGTLTVDLSDFDAPVDITAP
jgi:lipoprotein LprG